MTNKQKEIEIKVNDSYELPNKVCEVSPEPLVTVRTSTYQHGNFIKECIEGIINQKTNFQFEFIIGEDFSTDGTREIVFEYAKKYPNVIRVITADYNVGSKANGRRCIAASRGKYMAICEGDDYWTDPYKLQKQVDFLEANPEYVLTHTDYTNKNQETGEITEAIHESKGDIPNEEESCAPLIISDRYHVATCTAVFRMKESLYIDKKYADDFDERYVMGDYQRWFHLARLGKLKYLPEVTATYRRNAGSATAFFENKKRLEFIEKVYWQRRTFAERYDYPEQLPLIHFQYLRNLAFLTYRINGDNQNNEYYKKFKNLKNVSYISLMNLWGSFLKYRLKKIFKSNNN